MIKLDNVIILAFRDYVTNEMVPVVCKPYDLKLGYVTPKLCDEKRHRYYSIGRRRIEECVEVSKFTTLSTISTEYMLKWEERDKLYEKYPMLKDKEVHYSGEVGL